MEKKNLVWGEHCDHFIRQCFQQGTMWISTRCALLDRMMDGCRNPIAEDGHFDGFMGCANLDVLLAFLSKLEDGVLVVYAGNRLGGYTVGFCSTPKSDDDA